MHRYWYGRNFCYGISLISLVAVVEPLVISYSQRPVVRTTSSLTPFDPHHQSRGPWGRRKRSFIATSVVHTPLSTTSRSSEMTFIDLNDDSTSGTSRQAASIPLSSRIQTTDDPCVVFMKQLIQQHQPEYARRHPESDGQIYSLAQGVVYWTPPDVCQHAILKAFQDHTPLHGYSPDEGLRSLRQVLQTKIQNENGLTNHDIVVTCGANQAYMNCVLSVLSPLSSHAVIFAPYYFNHYMALQMTIGTEQILIGHLTQPQGLPDLQWLRTQFELHNPKHTEAGTGGRRIDMVTMTNPCNPTGIAYTKEQIQPLVNLCREFQSVLVLDATYEYFVHTDTTTTNSFTACFNDDAHVIHIFSLSKSYAMAGYRIGYMVLPRPQNTNNCNNRDAVTPTTTTTSSTLYENVMKVQDTIAIAPSHIGQIAALAAVQQAGAAWVQGQVQTLSVGRTAIDQALQLLQPHVMGGSGAMYVMARLPNDDDADNLKGTHHTPANDIDVAERLIQHYGIAVIPGTFCGAPGWIRICYANLPPDVCVRAARRLELGLQSMFGPQRTTSINNVDG